jgi:eukaryotic-like serine/threonine-protein kinase
MDFAAERKRLLQQLLQQEIDESTYERLRARLDEAERASVGDSERTSVGLLAPGFELDGYRLVDTLGGGGMGEVWAARHEQSKRDVALKILPEPFQKLPAELARFRATFHLVDKLHHPHICPLYELKHFAHPRIGWYQTMRLLRGRNLREFIEQAQFPGRRLPLDLVLRILRPVALALDYAHEQEVVHRDIKPENIFLEGSGLDILHVWLIDFGVAAEITATMTNALPEVETVGSRWYLAPEVWQAKRPKGTTDQYALACVAYELLEGTLPFQSADQYILRQAVLHDAVEPVDRVPGHVNAALLRALEKLPAKRFGSCSEFVEVLAATGSISPPDSEEIVFASVPEPDPLESQGMDFEEDLDTTRPDYHESEYELVPATATVIAQVRAATEKAGGTWPIPANAQATLRAMLEMGAFDLASAVLHADIAARTGRDKGNLLRDLTAAGHTLQYRRRGGNSHLFVLTSSGRSTAARFAAPQTSINTAAFPLPTVPVQRPRPQTLKSPFSKAEAEAGQRAWAESLGGHVYEKNTLGMEFAVIPPGSFQMGSPPSEKERRDNEGPVAVTLTRPYWLGRTPVTRGQWTTVMGTEPWPDEDPNWLEKMFGAQTKDGKLNHPATYISWEDSVEYCRRLTERDGGAWTYRLPTEAEWEWACRGGTLTAYWFGNELNGNQANCDGNNPYGSSQKGPYKKGTTAVGSYGANPFGLWDMHGNVWEWCADCYQEALPGGENPEVTSGGSSRVIRGGGWFNLAVNCRSACRCRLEPGNRSNGGLGFRVLAVPSPR